MLGMVGKLLEVAWVAVVDTGAAFVVVVALGTVVASHYLDLRLVQVGKMAAGQRYCYFEALEVVTQGCKLAKQSLQRLLLHPMDRSDL